MLRRTSCGECATLVPSTRTEPDVGFKSVASTLIVVVLPAPFGPMKPKISPRGMVSDRLRTATCLPKTTHKPWMSTTGMGGAGTGGSVSIKKSPVNNNVIAALGHDGQDRVIGFRAHGRHIFKVAAAGR